MIIIKKIVETKTGLSKVMLAEEMLHLSVETPIKPWTDKRKNKSKVFL